MGRTGVLETALEAKAALMGVKCCRCAEPDVEWNEAKGDFDEVCKTCGGTTVALTGDEWHALWAARGWTKEVCQVCGGHGVRWGGEDVYDCRYCCNGTVWFSPKGRRAHWPGGPFCG